MLKGSKKLKLSPADDAITAEVDQFLANFPRKGSEAGKETLGTVAFFKDLRKEKGFRSDVKRVAQGRTCFA
ncbi:MAG: hypothetical protein WCX27_02435 [Candidatus Paceibacterota bacterium]|jgi:hypothetical protein